jgi:translation initiation factor IF-2
LNLLRGKVDKSGQGVYVQTSSLGSMEALLEYLSSDACKVPVGGIRIGPVHKKDVTKASVCYCYSNYISLLLYVYILYSYT